MNFLFLPVRGIKCYKVQSASVLQNRADGLSQLSWRLLASYNQNGVNATGELGPPPLKYIKFFFLIVFFPLTLICNDKNTTELCSINLISEQLLNPSEIGTFLAVEVAATVPAEIRIVTAIFYHDFRQA